jgi:putative tricarboxylic transport membrane protein
MVPAAAQWKPERAAEIVVTAGAGGNQDLTARVIQKIWSDAKIVPSGVIVNKPGGGGAIAFSYLTQHAADPHTLLMLAPTMFTTRILGRNNFSFADITPVALLFNEYIFVSVRADSPIKNGRDLIRQLKADPSSLSVAVASALAHHIHMGIAMPMKAAGVDVKKMKVVAFKSSEQSLTALLGGHIDVAASTFGTVLPFLKAGKIRVIGVSAPQRLPGDLATIPTWKEQGAPATFDSWRGIVAAKGITDAQRAYWETAMEAVTRSPAWQEDLERNYRIGHFMKGAEAEKYWRSQYVELEDILTELGLAKRP